MKRSDREYEIYKALSTYIKLKYPSVIFRFDQAGNNLSVAQAGKNKSIQKGRAYPDLFIAEPTKRFFGLYLEIKKEGEGIYKKDGKTFACDHIKE